VIFKPFGVDFDVFVPFFGEVFFGEDGLNGAFVDAEAAVDAGFGIDVEHLEVGVFFVVFGGLDAIHGADINTGGVFGSDARFSDHMRHGGFPAGVRD